jgi:hypothetical protein
MRALGQVEPRRRARGAAFDPVVERAARAAMLALGRSRACSARQRLKSLVRRTVPWMTWSLLVTFRAWAAWGRKDQPKLSVGCVIEIG